jgi:hypothetical protein
MMICAFIVLLATMLLNQSGVSEPEPSDPIVSFTLTNSRVDFRLEKNGNPVANARVRILVGSQTWAEGETGETGRGTFPRPNSMYCQVVFDLGKGPSAPVPLTFLADDTVIPTQSPVLSGTSDCCVIPSRRLVSSPSDAAPKTSTGASLRDRVTIGVAVLLVNGTILGWILRRPRSAQIPTTGNAENNS